MRREKTKRLIITITDTDRKGKEIERSIRLFTEKYQTLRGVHDLQVEELNSATLDRT